MILKWLDTFLVHHKLAELVKDYKGQISYGRLGGIGCLFFATVMALTGLGVSTVAVFFPTTLANTVTTTNIDKILSYCSTLSLQFLGAAISLYIPGKASETFAKKWSPDISKSVVKTVSDPVVPKAAAPAIIIAVDKDPKLESEEREPSEKG